MPNYDSWQRLGSSLSFIAKTARALLDGSEYCFTQRNTKEGYSKELIQVAATALAALEDSGMAQADAIECIKAERVRQDEKFGATPRHLDPRVWVAVLIEETDEVNQEIEG